MRLGRTIDLTVAGGLLLAFMLFFLTVPVIQYHFPVGQPEGGGTDFVSDYGGTNTWTGELRPASQSWTDPSGQRVTSIVALSEESKNLRAIPLPVGFAVGSLLTLGLITIAARRPRKTAPEPAA